MKKGNTMNSVLYSKKLAQVVALTSVVGFGLAACSDGDRATTTNEDAGETHVAGESSSTSTSTTTTGPGFDRVDNPAGSVTGLVQDTNGNPLGGVNVYLAGQMATTDDGGIYFFDSVSVVSALGTDSGATLPNAAAPLLVSIAAPAGYLGATVAVTPSSQIDGSEGNSLGAADTGGGNTNPQTVFIDGFLAQAATAALPELKACITGTARIGLTGQAFPGAELILDFSTVNAADQTLSGTGGAVTYSHQQASATAGADGTFTFTGLASDSSFYLGSQGYNVGVPTASLPGGGSQLDGAVVGGAPFGTTPVGTQFEDRCTELGAVGLVPVINSDAIAPEILSVATNGTTTVPGAARTFASGGVTYGVLTDDELDTVRLTFTETIQSSLVDDNSLLIWDATVSAYNTGFTAAFTDSPLDMNMTITFDTPFLTTNNVPNLLQISLLVDDFQDTADNQLADSGTSAGGGAALVNYPFIALTGGAKAAYIRVDVCTYFLPITDAPSVQPSQIIDSALTTGGEEYLNLSTASLEAKSISFTDQEDQVDWYSLAPAGGAAVASGTTVDQLNNQTNGFNSATAGTGESAAGRLSALAGALGAAVAVRTDRALVTFTADVNASYNVSAATSGAALAVGSIYLVPNTSNPLIVAAAGTANGISITGANAGDVIEVGVQGAAPGTIVTVTPADSLGNGGTALTLTISDDIEPTVALNSGHGTTAVTGGAGTTGFGDGDELTEIGAAASQTVSLNVHPGFITESRAASTPLAGTLVGLANPILITTPLTPTLPAAVTNDVIGIIYDATSWITFDGSARGFDTAQAVTEPLSAVSLSGPSTVSNPRYQLFTTSVFGENANNQSLGGVDTVVFTVSDIFDFEGQAGSSLDFTGIVDSTNTTLGLTQGGVAIADNTASAAANAASTIVDIFPPMVESAYIDENEMVVTFHSPIQQYIGSSTTGTAASLTLNVTGVGAAAVTVPIGAAQIGGTGCTTTQLPALSNSNMTLSIPSCRLAAAGYVYATVFNSAGTSVLGDYVEAAYSNTVQAAAVVATDDPSHTTLMWSNVQDRGETAGNSWANRVPADLTDPNPNLPTNAARVAGACAPAAGVAGPATCLGWTGVGLSSVGAAGQAGQSPIFAMIDALGPFTVTTNNAGFTNAIAGTAQSFTVATSHPFDVDIAGGLGGGDTTVSTAECAAFFTWSAAANVFAGAPAGCTVAFSDGTAIAAQASSFSVSFTTTGATAAGQVILFGTFTSVSTGDTATGSVITSS